LLIVLTHFFRGHLAPNLAMVNLVNTIESFSFSLESDAALELKQILMKSLKKQLKNSDINKLKQSTLNPELVYAPIHAAIWVNSVEILQLILDTNRVDFSTAVRVVSRGKNIDVGVLDLAVSMIPPNIEIVTLLLEHIAEDISLGVVKVTSIGTLPFCLKEAIDKEYLDILDLLLANADLIKMDTFNPFYCLAYAILKNKLGVSSHLLLQLPQALATLDQHLPLGGRDMTLLDFARANKRTQICEQIEAIIKIGHLASHLKNGNSAVRKNSLKIEKAGTEEDIYQTKKDITKSEGGATSDVLEIKKGEYNDNDDEGSLSKKVSDVKCGSGAVEGSSNMKVDLEEKFEVKYSNDANGKICWQCLNYGKYMCVGCRKARFCSEECQLENWSGHKEYCVAKMNRIAFKEFRSLSASIFE